MEADRLEGRPIKSRVEKNESRNLWSQPPVGTQKPSTDVLQIMLPLVSCPLSLELDGPSQESVDP